MNICRAQIACKLTKYGKPQDKGVLSVCQSCDSGVFEGRLIRIAMRTICSHDSKRDAEREKKT
jgi:hypothetical protein